MRPMPDTHTANIRPVPTVEEGREIRELGHDETHLAYRAVLDLGRSVRSKTQFVDRINVMRSEGYRLVASFEDGHEQAAAIIGFREGHNLAWGHYLYLDDVVTREDHRGRGHGGALMAWIEQEARSLGCDEIHCDSGLHRHDAHRLYMNSGMHLHSHHFGRKFSA